VGLGYADQTRFGVKLLRLLALLMCLLIAPLIAVAETSMWRVSQGDDYFYLGGTIHLLASDDYPLPEEFGEAYGDADEVVFETDLAGANTPAFQQKLAKLFSYEDNRTLKSELKPETFLRLREFMESRGMPVSMFLRFKPWGAALTITIMEYQRIGMMPELGVEQYFTDLANEDNKDIQSLESVDEQLNVLASMAGGDPDESINYTLDDLETLSEKIEELKKDRNDNWMKDLVTFFDDDAIEIVLVGAMHLPGEDGLLTQLRGKGYRIEQLP